MLLTTSVLRSEPVSLELPAPPQVLRELPGPAKLLQAEAKQRPEPVRERRVRRGRPRRAARERPPDEEPANPRRFRRTEAARCYARA